MAHVDLCSGIGGFALGFEWAELSKPVLFCDIEPWSRQILAKHWPDVPIAEDVKELANDPDGLVPDCDILTAGYPCQSFSLAGKRRGFESDHHIWPFIFSIIQAKRPSFCVFENVYGHVTLGLDEVLSDLERESYATRPFIVPACATDAPHRRDRLWIICRNVADTQSKCRNERFNAKREKTSQRKGLQTQIATSSGNVANTDSKRLQGIRANDHSIRRKKQTERQIRLCSGTKTKRSIWQPQSSICGMADGLSRWVDEPRDIPRVSTGVPNRAQRLRGLGNAIVPQIAMRIGQTIKAVEETNT